MRRGRARRDGLGAYLLVLLTVVGTAAIATFVLGREQRAVWSTAKPFHRHLVAKSYDPITAVLHGYGPRATHARPGPRRAAVRAVVLEPGLITLLAGGEEVRRIATASGGQTLTGVARAVDDPDWLARDGGTVTAKAAVVVRRGASLTVAAPATRTLVLESRAGVFLGARAATLRLEGVTVRPSQRRSGVAVAADSTRPFVLAQRSSRMRIRDSRFRDLGHDWNTSYGVSWASGSSGSVTDSSFARCYIGLYTERAHDLLIRGNDLRENTLYGIDPHSGSRGIVVERNVSDRNGRHGIIFSQDVVDSVVRGNLTRGNHLNGIMMDAGSTGNLIAANRVEGNRGDGVVLASSPGNTIVDNRIVDNRVGVFVRGGGSQRRIAGNVVAGNARAAEGTDLAGGNDVHGNGGQWLPRRIELIWLAAVPATLLLWALTLLSRWTRDRRTGVGQPARG